ncbi:MAG TPA: hypothetical protein VKU19_13240 [Bryobacteraceae bacterium]|nr:hypothetical protein [Bryobacteraceae bacterium]
MPVVRNTETVQSFRLSNYSASLGPASELSRCELPQEIRESCPNNYQDRIRTLVLRPVHGFDWNHPDITAVVLDVLRAGFLVLSFECRKLGTDPGGAYLFYVCSGDELDPSCCRH